MRTGDEPARATLSAAWPAPSAGVARLRSRRARMVLWQVVLAGAEVIVFWQHLAPALLDHPLWDGVKLGAGTSCELTLTGTAVQFGAALVVPWLLLRILATGWGLQWWPVLEHRSSRFRFWLAVTFPVGLFVAATVVLAVLGGWTYESGACSWWSLGQPTRTGL